MSAQTNIQKQSYNAIENLQIPLKVADIFCGAGGLSYGFGKRDFAQWCHRYGEILKLIPHL